MVLLLKKVYTLFSTLAVVVLVSFLILVFTPLGFPYCGDPDNLAPQRFMVAVSVILCIAFRTWLNLSVTLLLFLACGA